MTHEEEEPGYQTAKVNDVIQDDAVSVHALRTFGIVFPDKDNNAGPTGVVLEMKGTTSDDEAYEFQFLLTADLAEVLTAQIARDLAYLLTHRPKF